MDSENTAQLGRGGKSIFERATEEPTGSGAFGSSHHADNDNSHHADDDNLRARAWRPSGESQGGVENLGPVDRFQIRDAHGHACLG